MQSKKRRIEYEDVVNVFKIWTEIEPAIAWTQMTNFLGTGAWDYDPLHRDYLVSTEAAERIKMVLGPHGRTMIKAWIARRGGKMK